MSRWTRAFAIAIPLVACATTSPPPAAPAPTAASPAVTAPAPDIDRALLALCPADALACELAAIRHPLDTLWAACTADVPGACLVAEWHTVRVRPFDRERHAALARFIAACGANQHAACALAIAVSTDEVTRVGGVPDDWSPDEAGTLPPGLPTIDRLDTACDAQEPAACALIAWRMRQNQENDDGAVYARIRGLAERLRRGPRLGDDAEVDPLEFDRSPALDAACTAGDPLACWYAKGESAPVACANGILPACGRLFGDRGDAVALEPALEDIGNTLRSACDKGFREACAYEAERLVYLASDERLSRLGSAVWDEQRALEDAEERAFAEGKSTFTAGLAVPHVTSPGKQPPFDQARTCALVERGQGSGIRFEEGLANTLERACRKRRPSRDGEPEKSVEALAGEEASCLGTYRSLSSCVRASELHASGGPGFTASKDEAVRFAELACKGDDLDGCRIVAELTHDASRFIARVLASPPYLVAAAFEKSPELFRHATGLRAYLDREAGQPSLFALDYRARLEGFDGPPDPPGALALARDTCRLYRDADEGGRPQPPCTLLREAKADPALSTLATRGLCFALGGTDCEGLALPHETAHLEGVPDSARAVAIADGHALVLGATFAAVFDLSTGTRVGEPFRWVPREERVERLGRRFGRAWSVGEVQLALTPAGPALVAHIERQVDERTERLLATLAPGRPLALLGAPNDGSSGGPIPFRLDAATGTFWWQPIGRPFLEQRRLDDPAQLVTKVDAPASARWGLSKDGRILATAAPGDGRVLVRELAGGRVRTVALDPSETVQWIELSPEGARLLVGTSVEMRGGRTWLFDLSTEPAALLLESRRALFGFTTDATHVLDWVADERALPALERTRPPRPRSERSAQSGDIEVFVNGGSGVVVASTPVASQPLPAWASARFSLPAFEAAKLPEFEGSADLQFVVLNQSKPVAGARIDATPCAAYAEHPGLTEAAARLKPWSAVSDAAGRIVKSGLLRGCWFIEATAPLLRGFAVYDLALPQEGAREVRMWASRVVSGWVLDEKSKPVAGVEVELSTEGEVLAHQKSGKDGAFLFDHVKSADHVQACRRDVCAGARLGSYETGLSLELPARDDKSTVKAFVVGESGRPAEGASLLGLRVPRGGHLRFSHARAKYSDAPRIPTPRGPKPYDLEPPFKSEVRWVVPDGLVTLVLPKDGVWTVRAMTPDSDTAAGRRDEARRVFRWARAGHYEFAGHDRQGRKFRVAFELAAGERRVVEPPVTPARTLRGRVVDAAGKPVAGAFVNADHGRVPGFDSPGRTQAKSGPDGTFVMNDLVIGGRAFSVNSGYARCQYGLLPDEEQLGDVTCANVSYGSRALRFHSGDDARGGATLELGRRTFADALAAAIPGMATTTGQDDDDDESLLSVQVLSVNGQPIDATMTDDEFFARLLTREPGVVHVSIEGATYDVSIPVEKWRTTIPAKSR